MSVMSVLSAISGDCPQIKILEAFAENERDMLYIAEIISLTNLSKMTVNSYIRKLLDENIIKKTDKTGKIQYYKLNKNNPKTEILLLLEKFIADNKLGNLIKNNEVDGIEKIVKVTSIQTKIDTEVSSSTNIASASPLTSMSTQIINLTANTNSDRKDVLW